MSDTDVQAVTSFSSENSTGTSVSKVAINLTAENKYIQKIIITWIKSKVEADELKVINLHDIVAPSSISNNKNEEMIATVRCFCGTNIKIQKNSRLSGGSSRWISMNYYSYFTRKHAHRDKKKTNTLDAFLIFPNENNIQENDSAHSESHSESIQILNSVVLKKMCTRFANTMSKCKYGIFF